MTLSSTRTTTHHLSFATSRWLLFAALSFVGLSVTAASTTSSALPTTPPADPTTPRHAAPHHAALETSIFAESALVDKETGRIFWEGGSTSTLSGSLESRFQSLGLLHARATLVSVLLWVVVYGWISSWLRQQVQTSQFIQNLQTNVMAAIPIALCKWTLLAVPRVPVWVSVVVIVIYITEAYLSDTHQFLAHRSDSHDVEAFIEQLREQVPQIVWKVRAFHYEPLALLQMWRKWTKPLRRQSGDDDNIAAYDAEEIDSMALAYPFRRKCVSHQAAASFVCPEGGWHDKTTAGIWTRASGETRRGPAPLAKIHLTKVLVLGNGKARQEYFEQQARFVAENGRDQAAEFATSIEVPGYKPRVLVTRDRQASLLFSRRAFWVCTLLGLTLFYRVWMAGHCDVIRVSLVKETFARVKPEKKVSWWLPQKSTPVTQQQEPNTTATTKFRSLMTQLELYRPKNVTAVSVKAEAIASVRPAEKTTSLNETGSVSLEENITSIEEAVTTSENTKAVAEEGVFTSDSTPDLPISVATNTTIADESVVLSSDNTTRVGDTTVIKDDPLVAINTTAVIRGNAIPETNSSATNEPENLKNLNNETKSSGEERDSEDTTRNELD